MHRLRPIVALSLFCFGLTLRAQPALRPGEALTYRVGWGILTGAGEIKISAQTAPAAGPARLVATTTTATRGFARALYTFDARADALLDPATGRLHSHTQTSTTKQKQTRHVTTFDYVARTASYRDELSPEKSLTFALPRGDPLDLIMSLVQTRTWNLKPGDQRDALVLFEEEAYELTIHAVRYEDVTTRLGTFRTLVLEPRMEKTPPKGMFKKGSAVRVWIAQDDPRRLPVKFEVEFKFGSGVATLVAYQPPADLLQK
ncbi:MAG: DUF3108 domain-containing protein [Undibacterium sp.]|nr:DUF3108 domain-containing protein [Opitutaceae bacterium]